MTVSGVSGETAMAHHRVVLAGELGNTWLSREAAATGPVRGSRPVPADVSFVGEPGYAWLCGGVSSADDVVGP
jgi:hypothetical protein